MLAQDPNQVLATIAGILLGTFGIPFGIPPDKEDELLARVAPPVCVYYSSTAGVAAVDPNSPNSTDKLLVSPEVKKTLALIEKGVEKAIAMAEMRGGPQAGAMARESWKRAKYILTRPNAMWVESFRLEMSPTGEPVPADVKGAAIVNLGAEGPAIRDLFTEAVKQQGEPEEVTIGNYKFKRLPASPKLPATLTWGLVGQYFVIGFGDTTIDELVARGRNQQPPAWLTKIRTELPISRRATLAYLNVAEIRKILAPATKQVEKPILEALGLDNITALESTTGLDADGFISKVRIGTTGAPGGALKILEGPGLTPADVADVPEDATVAVVLKIDPAKAVDLAIGIADRLQPGSGTGAFDQASGHIQQELGVDLRKDFIAALGTTWRAYSSPADGDAVYPGATLVVDLKDPAAFMKCLNAVVAKHDMQAGGDDDASKITKSNPVPGVEMWTLKIPDAPVMPSWAIVGKKLIVAAAPETLTKYLKRDASFASLGKNPRLTSLLQEQPGRAYLIHVNLAQLLERYGPLAQGAIQGALGDLFGDDFDPNAVPQIVNLVEYLQPQWNTARYTAGGIEFETRSTLPSANVVQSVPVQVALLLPAVQAAREAARRNMRINQARQVALAVIVHESATNRYPPAFTVDKNGKPLHSWRVLILPYLEEQLLYQQLKLDEPWDSAHNKPILTSRMPAIYRHPADPANTTKTRFLSFRQANSIFPGSEMLRPRDISDGTSKTVLFMEVAPEAAVEWYKPDDFVMDEKDPKAKLFDPLSKLSIAAFADGHVITVPSSVDPITLKAIITRNGGEVTEEP